MKKPSPVAQSLLLTALAFAYFAAFYDLGLNAVMHTYYLGGLSFVQGLDPYQITLLNGPSNQFKYSPLFAVIMAELATGDQLMVASLWILAGIAAFSFGLSRWSDLIGKMPVYAAFSCVAALIDLTVSMASYQANALIIGFILLGLAEHRDGRFFTAGAILMLATNIKIYPVVFLLAAGLRFRSEYWMGALCAGIMAFALPAFVTSWDHNLEMHLSWFRVIVHDSVGSGVLDLVSAFQRLGLDSLGRVLRVIVLAVSVPLFFSYSAIEKRTDWRPWMTFGIASLLLLSPRTEVYTYVLLAPSYLLMVHWCAESGDKKVQTFGSFLCAVLAVAIASCRYIDPIWYQSESALEIVRVLGALGFWILTGGIVGTALLDSLRIRKTATVG